MHRSGFQLRNILKRTVSVIEDADLGDRGTGRSNRRNRNNWFIQLIADKLNRIQAFAAADANQDIRTLNILVLSQFGHILIRRFMAINDFFDDFQ